MKTPTNNKPRKTYFNDAKLQESLNKAYILDALERKEIIKKFEVQQKELFESFDKEKAGILKSADMKGFLNEKKTLDKKYSHLKQLDSTILKSASSTEYKVLLTQLYIKSNIDVQKISKLKTKYKDKLIKTYDKYFFPNMKELEIKDFKKNEDFNPPYRSVDESIRSQFATNVTFYNSGANADSHYTNAYGYANEQSGHIILTSHLGLRGASNSSQLGSHQIKSFFIKFIPETPGQIFLNFEQYIHQRLFTSMNYNEPGFSDISIHYMASIPAVRIIALNGSGDFDIGQWVPLPRHEIDANTELDNTFAVGNGGFRLVSDYVNIGSATNLVIIEFGIHLSHYVKVDA